MDKQKEYNRQVHGKEYEVGGPCEVTQSDRVKLCPPGTRISVRIEGDLQSSNTLPNCTIGAKLELFEDVV